MKANHVALLPTTHARMRMHTNSNICASNTRPRMERITQQRSLTTSINTQMSVRTIARSLAMKQLSHENERSDSVTKRGSSGVPFQSPCPSSEGLIGVSTQKVQQRSSDWRNSSLLCLSNDVLTDVLSSFGQPQYRAQQIETGMYRHRAKTIHDIRGLPKVLKDQLLESGFNVGRSEIAYQVKANDGTVKLLLRQPKDGKMIECVGIPFEKKNDCGKNGSSSNFSKDRMTVCVSSQVGCAMRCSFCATGKMGFTRNLEASEIVDQVMWMEEYMNRRATNVVFMGMGEPLMNSKNVIRAYEQIWKKIGLSSRNITISTVGVPNQIRKLAQLNLKCTLAVSLHAPNQTLRQQLIPAASAYPLDALLEDCLHYFESTGRRISFEYTLLNEINDNISDAEQLASLLRSKRMASAHVNLIPYNSIDDCDYQRPSRNRIFKFMETLHKFGLKASIRETRGLEEAAACGQLRNNLLKRSL